MRALFRGLLLGLGLALAQPALAADVGQAANNSLGVNLVNGPGGWYNPTDHSGPYAVDSQGNAKLLGSGSIVGGVAVQSTVGTITNPADVSCAATTVCTLSNATTRKYLSVVNTSNAALCRIGYGITPSATQGDPLSAAAAAGGQGGTRTFETSFVPSGQVKAYCSANATLSILEGN